MTSTRPWPKAMRQTDWPALCQLAADLRDGVPCEPLDHATNGLNNMARLLRFADGQPHDDDERQRWRERREYVQTVAVLEALEQGPGVGAGGDDTLSACLADEHAQALSYAMEAFEGGKMGFYDQLLDDLEEGLSPGGESL